MITRLIDCQNAYFEVATTNENLKEKCLIDSLIYSNQTKVAGCRDLYNRFVQVQPVANFEIPTEEGYQQNLKTLWTITQKARECLINSDRAYADQMSGISKRMEHTETAIKQQEEANAVNVPCGCYHYGQNQPITAYSKKLGRADLELYKRFDAYQQEFIIVQRHLLQTRNEVMCKEMRAFAEIAINEGSFFLLHDIITLVDAGAFYPQLNTQSALQEIEHALDCRSYVTANIAFPERVKKACAEMGNLKMHLYYIMNRYQMSRFFDENFIENQLGDLLLQTLIIDVKDSDFIKKIKALNLISKAKLTTIVEAAFSEHIANKSYENAQLIMRMDLTPESDFISVLSMKFSNALKESDISLAKFIYVFNMEKSPLKDDQLGNFFVCAATEDNIELVQFIHGIAGELKIEHVKEAYQKAQENKCTNVLPYLNANKLNCVIS